MESKKAFYTALFVFGDQASDAIGKFEKIPGWDYILFTNKEPSYFGHCIWKVRQIQHYDEKSPTVSSKHLKWMPHLYLPEYSYLMWLDAWTSPNPEIDFTPILEKLETLDIPLMVLKHPQLSCIYDECQDVLTREKDLRENVDRVRALLAQEGMPKNYGLYENTTILRKPNHDQVKAISEAVFFQVDKYSHRDQLALTYVLWKMEIKSLSCFEQRPIVVSGKIVNHRYTDRSLLKPI